MLDQSKLITEFILIMIINLDKKFFQLLLLSYYTISIIRYYIMLISYSLIRKRDKHLAR